MNEWIRKSIDIANSPGYLDELHGVYPVSEERKRRLDPEIFEELRKAFDSNDTELLLKRLIRLDKSPVKDPYMAFFKKDEKFIGFNPQTAQRIADRVLKIGFDNMIEEIEAPKEFNRQMGSLFYKWLPTIGIPMLPSSTFEKSSWALLKASDKEMLAFANAKIKMGLEKRPDLIAKVGTEFVVGEAKFLTDYGGHQTTQFKDALRLARSKKGKAHKIAILDGIIWIKGKNQLHQTLCGMEETALSALLLMEFLQSLRSS
jgi:hypothetical protein